MTTGYVNALPPALVTARTEPHRQPSGDHGLTPLAEHFAQGAVGWLKFFAYESTLFREAREKRGVDYLDYGEWNLFFKAALRHGCVQRADLSGEIVPLVDYSAQYPRDLRRLSGRFFQALLIETFRQVRDAKKRGDSPFQLAMWMRNNSTAYDAMKSEKQRLALEAVKLNAPDDLNQRRRRQRDNSKNDD